MATGTRSDAKRASSEEEGRERKRQPCSGKMTIKMKARYNPKTKACQAARKEESGKMSARMKAYYNPDTKAGQAARKKQSDEQTAQRLLLPIRCYSKQTLFCKWGGHWKVSLSLSPSLFLSRL